MTKTFSDEQLLARLVAFDTTSCHSNLPAVDFLCDYLDHPGIELIRQPAVDEPKANLIVRIGGTDTENTDRHGLVLSGHLDVVPANEPDWRSDPFTLTETADAYVGRGACDMKGFVTLAVNLARQRSTASLKHPLVLILTYDEEVGSFGALNLVRHWQPPFGLPRSAIIGEPTSLRVVRMHKGHLKMRITLRGQGAHSGYPHLGVNAIEPAARVIAALTKLRRTLETERTDTSVHFPETPYVALNVAMIAGGEAINIVPDKCVVDVGLRALPGMKSDTVIDLVQSTIEGVADRGQCEVEVLHDNPPMLLAEESSTNQTLCDIMSQAETYGVSYATDAGVLQQLDLECAIFGPGTIEVAHKPNESMPKSEFAEGRRFLERVIDRMCG